MWRHAVAAVIHRKYGYLRHHHGRGTCGDLAWPRIRACMPVLSPARRARVASGQAAGVSREASINSRHHGANR